MRPTTSDYLLAGLVRCVARGGAYVGVGAHGRGGFYRYYVCRTRQANGARGCTGQRIPADLLEDAIIADLLSTYDNFDFIAQAAKKARRGDE
jgi:hypothetical protein